MAELGLEVAQGEGRSVSIGAVGTVAEDVKVEEGVEKVKAWNEYA